jgi:ArsR family transcriptional regulator
MNSSARPRLVDQLAAAADGLRGRLLLALDGRELTVGEICEVVQLPQSTVSRHLKTLADAGWITSRREATNRFYGVASDDLSPAARRVWNTLREELAATPAAEQDELRLKGVLAQRRTTSEEFFSSAAGQWDRLREELFGRTSHLRLLAALLDREWVVGDLGCGTGQMTEVVAPFVRQVVAVDASREMLHAARARLAGAANVELRKGALERLPLDDDSLDAAIVALVLHHVPDPSKVCAEVARVLKPGGRLVIADMLPHEHEDYRKTMGHVWLGFAPKQVERMLAGAGFESIRVNALATEAGARGPALFVAAAAATQRATKAGHEGEADAVGVAVGAGMSSRPR